MGKLLDTVRFYREGSIRLSAALKHLGLQMFRVIHVINSVDWRSGGPVYALRHLLQEQLERGYHLRVVATDMQAGVGGIPREHFHRETLADPLWQKANIVLGTAFGRGRPWNHLGFAASARKIIDEAIRDLEPDLIHVHGVFGWITSTACRQSYRSGLPFVLEPYGAYDPLCFWSHFWPLKWAWHNLWGKWELLRAAVIKVASHYEAEPFLKSNTLRPKVVVIPYGVAITSEQPRETADFPIVCFVSRIARKKRPEWVVEACHMLKREFPDLKVVIAGSDDGHRAYLEEFVRHKAAGSWVEIRDFVQGEAKERLFRSASVIVLPSRDESLGAVVLEALAAGVPAVVTPGVAAKEHVRRSGCGVVVEDNIESLAIGIRGLLKSDRVELGRQGRAYAEKHLTWTIVANQVEDVYRQVVDNYGPHAGSLPDKSMRFLRQAESINNGKAIFRD